MRALLRGIVDFFVGDDVWVAVGVGGAVVLTAALTRLVDPWWLLPLAVPAIVAVSLLRAARRA